MREQIIIHPETCIGCGLCIEDCPSKVLELKDKKAIVMSDECIKCGHCLAICPKDAVEITDLDKSEIKSYKDLSEPIPSDQLMDFYKSLRTVRKFTNQEVDNYLVEQIIDAGRFTSTATNQQGVRYIVVRDEIEVLEDMVLPKLITFQKIFGFLGKFIKMKYNLERYNFEKGFLFKDSKALILLVSKHDLDAGLAARSMELMSRTLGLAGLHVGIFTAIANRNKAVRKRFGLEKKENVVACLALGYPDVKYQRTVPRRKAKVEWR